MVIVRKLETQIIIMVVQSQTYADEFSALEIHFTQVRCVQGDSDGDDDGVMATMMVRATVTVR